MIKITQIISFTACALLLLSGCREEKLSDVSVVDTNIVQRQHTELDKWIGETITAPYGIDVVYRWERHSSQPGNFTYPPKADKIKPVLETIKHLWIDLYSSDELAMKDGIIGKTPIRIYLYGGKNVDQYGFEHLSNPLSPGLEMHIYNVNDFDPKEQAKVYALMRSVHHQFARRLSELFSYDRDRFLMISRHRYISSTGDFLATVQKGISDRGRIFSLSDYGHKRGCLTINSLLSAEDDFAEIISATIMHTPKEISSALNAAATPYPADDPAERQRALEEAKKSHLELTTKIDFVNEYFTKNIGIRLSRLQRANNKLMRAYLSK